MFKPKTKLRLKRTLSGVLALVMTVSLAAVMPVAAEETAKYPYAVFAADEDAGITVNTDSLTLNGNAYTNGVFSATVQYPNINGTVTDNDDIENENNTEGEETEDVFDVSKDMILIHTKLTDKYFTENCDKYDEDYTYSDMNVNINNAVYVTGKLNLDGNISLNNAIGAVSDVDLSGGNLNGNNTVIYSKFGDIDITNSQATVNGLIYAPFGTVTIDCDNFNMNGLIIAQNVVIDGYGANINYSSSWAELVGTESEELSWTFDDWQYLADTDEDGLPNLIEKEIGSDPYNPDTDGDGLPDGYEALTLETDPTKPDTDDNGVLDCDEDFDEDGLTNLQEYEQGTEPYNEDTDGDGLKDGEGINTYGTDPLKVDTDDDELEDGDEIYFETDPLNPDSDGNGIPDGDEKRLQTLIHKVENEDCAVTEVRVSMEGTGNLQKTTTVESIMNKDILCSDVVGLVGEPFSIETTSQFDKATLTYVVDKSKLGDTEFDNLLFLWYDEENDNFVELDTVLDEQNSTVSVETTHFSKYMLVDQVEWFKAWKNASLYFEDTYEPLATVICYDCSGSMGSNDRTFNYNIFNDDGTIAYSYPTCYRKLAIDGFIDSMMLTDKTALVSFEDYATLVSGFSNDNDVLKSLVKPYNSGGTNARAALDIAISQLETVEHWYSRHVILLSDGDVNVTANQILQAKTAGIKIHTIGLGSGANNQKLQNCARDTSGQFFAAKTAEELNAIYSDLSKDNHFDLEGLPDEDEDGLPDEFEVSGLVLSNAQVVYTDPENPDCDDDDLLDGQEISIDGAKSKTVKVGSADGGYVTYSTVVFRYISNPNQKYCYDSKHNATLHTLKFDGEIYKCTKCAFSAKSPVLEDNCILNDDDKTTIQALNYVLMEFLLEESNGDSSKYYAGDLNYHKECILQIMGEIDRIRRKDIYKYEYADENGYCIPEVINLEAYKDLSSHLDCTVITDIISDKNYSEYNFWYGDGCEILESIIGFIYPYLGASLSVLNDLTSPETYQYNNSEMMGLFVFSLTENYTYTIASDKEFKECQKIHGKEKAIYEQRNRDVLFELGKKMDEVKNDTTDDKTYDIQYGDYFIRINFGYCCPQCKIDPDHEGSDSRDHFKYTRTISTVVWIRDGNMLYYNKT